MIVRVTVAVWDLRPGDVVDVDPRAKEIKRLLAAGYLVPEAKRKRVSAS